MGLISTFVRLAPDQINWEYGVLQAIGTGQERFISMGEAPERATADACAWLLTTTGENIVEEG